ncbi:MAG TPA: peroxidase family protein [Acidimicrobiales bacterium]|nr:peroxidase family protein [Acidimicrobiales bacterium]
MQHDGERLAARKGLSRRRFLTRIGVGAAGAATLGPTSLVGPAGAQTDTGASGAPSGADGTYTGSSRSFGRIFKDRPFAEDSPQLQAALHEIARPGGMLDAGDDLSKGPAALILDPELRTNNPDNPTHTAGTTFVGQFLDHDMTFDTTSALGRPTDPRTTRNARTPTLDLDSVYGGGPVVTRELYDSADGIKLKMETGGLFEDLPRGADNVAVIGDPRNDENLIVCGIHLAMMCFHNKVVDRLRVELPASTDAMDIFHMARREVTWHYHWLILHEFLPQFVGRAMVDDILARGRRFYTTRSPYIPVEFSGAAYRFGHSMVRPSYRANRGGGGAPAFFGMVFEPTQMGSLDPDDMSGRLRAARRFIGWETFFDFGDGEVRNNKLIDTKLSTPLFNLPAGTISRPPGAELGPTSLAERNLLRHITWGLPSGQQLAQRMGAPALAPADLDDLSGFGLGLERSTPLWFYILREAEVMAGGHHLGPVGGRIVGEVIIGLLQSDGESYLAREPGWRPTLPAAAGGGDFRMVDLLRMARVDPVGRLG